MLSRKLLENKFCITPINVISCLNYELIKKKKTLYFRIPMVKYAQKWVCDRWVIGKNTLQLSPIPTNLIHRYLIYDCTL